MKFFRLYPDCRYLRGPSRGTLYNLTAGQTHQLAKSESAVVDMLIGPHSVEYVIGRYAPAAEALVDGYVEKGVGALYDSPVYSEPYLPTTQLYMPGLFEGPPRIRGVTIQISDACNAGCDFCNSGAYYNFEGCNSCVRWPCGGGKDILRGDNLARIVDRLNEFIMPIPVVVFSGGNPLLEFDAVAAAAARFRTRNPDIRLLVNTNGAFLDDNVARTAREMGFWFNFTLFGASRKQYTRVTGNADLYDKLLAAIALCKEHQITYLITPLVSSAVRDAFSEMKEFGKSCGGIVRHSAEPLLHGAKKVTGPTGPSRLDDVMNMELYAYNTENSYCMGGMIAIASNGTILPCPMWPQGVGNVITDERFITGLGLDKLEECWKMNNDLIPVCRECENRYACMDCALLSWHSRSNPLVHKMFCDYVPETGEWESGELLHDAVGHSRREGT